MRKLLGLAFISLLASVGHAAEGGRIAGTILGPDGAPFKAAFVRAMNMQSKMTTIVLSNRQGSYVLTNLAPGGLKAGHLRPALPSVVPLK